MLMVFLMASMIAISLYLEMPRVAMETQRAKEQLLIDRGEQYKRAIQLFVKDAKRYPGDIKDLESFQNKRYLRHRYIDPMTGKDEWRLIHIQNGILTDSLVNKQGQAQQKEASTAGMFIGEQAGLGGTNLQGAGGAVNVRDRRRATDGGIVNGPPTEIPPVNANNGMPAQPAYGQPVNGQPVPGSVVNGTNIIPGQQLPPGVPGVPGMPGNNTGYPGGTIPGVPGMPGNAAGRGGTTPGSSGTTYTPSFVGGGGSLVGGSSLVGSGSPVGSQPGTPGFSGQYPGGTYPGQALPGQTLPGQPGMPVNSQTGGVMPQQNPYSTQQGVTGAPAGFPQPGTTPGAPNNAAADLIRNILTTPRPGGMPTQTAMGGQTIGGGIAGVASTSEGEGVKVYNDRTMYAEWEFIFDPQKVKQIPNPNVQGVAGTPASQMGNMQGTGPAGTPVQPNPFGQPPGMLGTQPGQLGSQPGQGR